ncbi:MAG: hypothetical protein COB53_11175 [Elusimicrobia bacterium]|nr:MAG: hypothetical protein COB53_11175 [Elusimicrobiota bacterium]
MPPPVDASSMIEMPVIERSDSRSLWVGGAALATAYAAVTFFISSIFAWPLVGAAFVVFFITGLAGVITYMSALSTRYSKFGTDTWVNDPARARAGTIMLNAGFLSGVFAVALAVFAPAATAVGLLAFTGMVRRDFMVSPATLYERAFYEAKQHADGPLHFGEATISSPVHDGDHWKFNFFSIPEGDGAKAKMISIDFHKGGGLVSIDGFHSKAYTYKDVPLPADQPVFPITPEVFKSAVQMTPEEALTEVQRVAAIRGGVSISLRAEVQGEKGAHGDFKYRFYDNSGYEVAVNARSREVRVLKEPRVETREERLERFKAWKSLRDLDVWLGEHLPLYTFLKWAAIIGAGIFLIDMFFNIPAMIGAVGAIGVLGAGGYLVRRDSMPKPVDLYTRALEEAKEASGGMPVKFVRATASYPLTDQKWIYTFHADHPKLADKMRMIDISFANGMLVIAGNFETQQHVYTLGGDLSQFGEGRVMDVDAFSTIARITPDEALAAAKQRIPAFLTVRSSIELTANGGSAGMSYRIYDEKGNVAAVDAVNGEVFEAVEAEVTPPTGIVDWFFSLIK